MEPDLMTYDEVAPYLRYSKSRLYELVRQGCIPTVRMGGKTLFERAAVEKIKEQGFHLPATFTHEPTAQAQRGRAGARARWGDRLPRPGKTARPRSGAAKLRRKAK